MELKHATYGIVGLGIMGGSFAKAIRQHILSQAGATGRILTCNRSTACLSQVMAEGVADATFTADRVDQMLPLCDIVFICLYPHATLDFMQAHRDRFKGGAIVTDISGVKGIFERAMPQLVRDDVDFIIGHPMAGGEKEGYAHSDAAFFVNHNYILCPTPRNKSENLDTMRTLVAELGFTRITETTCETHDHNIGFTSQLCHVIASALVESAEDPEITAFGGGSFEDLTRIAMINAPLWSELFIANREKLVAHIERFERQMEQFKTLIATSDSEGLRALLSHTRDQRLRMGSIRTVK